MRILFAYDGSDHADAAIAKAGELLAGTGGEAVVLSVWEPLTVSAIRLAGLGGGVAVPLDSASEDERSEEQARELAEHGAELARRHGFDAKPAAVADTRAIADTIVHQAEQLDVDLIVLGARGLAGVRAFLGSVSNRVIQHAHRPTLVVPPQGGRDG
jgi:nucleotide-binding universal stress UspA family protein